MRKYSKKILSIAIPIMLANLVSQLQMLIDKMYLGKLDIKCMSAVGNANSPMWTTMGVIFSLAMGATILMSQAYGADDRKQARAIAASMFKYNNALAIILFFFWFFCPQVAFRLMGVDESIIDLSITYARIYSPIFVLTGIGASITSMLQVSQKTTIMIAYGVVRSVINVVLDYAMIFGHFGFKPMGVAGAAYATLIAELTGSAIIVIYVLCSKDLWLRPTFSEIMSANIKLYIDSIKLGVPAAAEDFAWNFGNLYLIAMLNKVSIEAAGIHSIIFGIECVAIVIVGSFGNATLTLAGFETGSGNKKGVWDVSVNAFLLGVIVCSINLLFFIIFPTQILGIFTTEEAIIASAPVYLLIVAIDLFPKTGNIIFGSGIKGYGNPVWMLCTQIFGTIFVIAASSYMVLGLHLGMTALFCLVVADESIRFVFNFWKINRIKAE